MNIKLQTCFTSGCQRKAIDQSPSKVFCAPCSDAIARGRRTERKLSTVPALLEALETTEKRLADLIEGSHSLVPVVKQWLQETLEMQKAATA